MTTSTNTSKRAGRPSHDEEVKRQAVMESRAHGSTVVNVARKYGVSANTLQNWRKAYPATGALAAPRTRIARAQRTTVAINGNTDLVQMLRQELALARAEIKLLRDIYFEQEYRHRGLDRGAGISQQQRQMIPGIPEGIQANGSLSATN
jgi:transposase-like protein